MRNCRSLTMLIAYVFMSLVPVYLSANVIRSSLFLLRPRLQKKSIYQYIMHFLRLWDMRVQRSLLLLEIIEIIQTNRVDKAFCVQFTSKCAPLTSDNPDFVEHNTYCSHRNLLRFFFREVQHVIPLTKLIANLQLTSSKSFLCSTRDRKFVKYNIIERSRIS